MVALGLLQATTSPAPPFKCITCHARRQRRCIAHVNQRQPSCSTKGHDSQLLEHPSQPSRRSMLVLGAAFLTAAADFNKAVQAAEVPAAPAVGSCADCIGEENTTLNVCTESSLSCVSTQNDDEAHFLPPWSYDGPRAAAVERLVSIATGAPFDSASQEPFGISRSSAASYILGGVANVVQGKPPPDQPQRAEGTSGTPFDGVVADRHTTQEGAEYVRITLGTASGMASEVDDPSAVIDVEFLFLDDDNIIVLRAASRVDPQASQGSLSLDFSKGIVYDKNRAARTLEKLRKALRFEVVPVITDFDPRFNSAKPLWFERLFQAVPPFGTGRPRFPGDDGSQQVGEDHSERPLVDGRRV